jgi:hypothetical protein
VPPGGYAELHFIARDPVRTGALVWKALQRYDGGEVVRWIGSANSDRRAPVTRLGESAAPVDVVSTHGQAAPAPAPAAVSPPTGATADGAADAAGRDGPTLAVAIAAALFAATALGLQLRGRS